MTAYRNTQTSANNLPLASSGEGWDNMDPSPWNTAACLATSSVTTGPVLTRYSAALIKVI